MTPTLLMCYGMKINQPDEVIISVDRAYDVEVGYVIDWTIDSNEMEILKRNANIMSKNSHIAVRPHQATPQYMT